MIGIPLNFFIYFMALFFLSYLFYHSFNLISVTLNMLALSLIPCSIKITSFLADPMNKIMLTMLICFISGVLIIWNQQKFKSIANKKC